MKRQTAWESVFWIGAAAMCAGAYLIGGYPGATFATGGLLVWVSAAALRKG
ncbi:MAG: hypothetical protein KJO36_00385 [Acidimicrobiia bacterium]|nr:hypothetical protein [Acidimicrobiia bacterium]